jgi:hypothetical protein
MTDKITTAVVHGAAQFTVSTFVGKILDGILPYNPSKCNILQLGTEIILQISADVICTAAVMDYLNNSLSADQSDPAGGFAYMIGLMYSQPQLIQKINKMNAIIGSKLSGMPYLNMNKPMGVQRVPVPTQNQFVSGNAAYN